MKRIELGLRMVALAIVLVHVLLRPAKADEFTDAQGVKWYGSDDVGWSTRPVRAVVDLTGNPEFTAQYPFQAAKTVKSSESKPATTPTADGGVQKPGTAACTPAVAACSKPADHGTVMSTTSAKCDSAACSKPSEQGLKSTAQPSREVAVPPAVPQQAEACFTAPPCIFVQRVPRVRVGRAFSFRRWLIGGCK